MQCFLTKEDAIEFSKEYPRGILGKWGTVQLDYQCNEDSPGYNQNVSDALQRMLNCYQNWIDIRVCIILKEPQSLNQGILQVYDAHSFLRDVSKLPGIDAVQVKVIISELRRQSSLETTQPGIVLTTKEMSVIDNPEKTCEDISVQLPDSTWYDMFQCRGDTITARITIQMTVHSRLHLEKPVTNNMEMYEKMLHDQLYTDLIIVCDNGKQVQCHKSILSASSPVFKAMIETDMKEGKTNKVKINDMTEAGIRALLEYLYYQCEEKPNGNSGIAFELFYASHKYDVIQDLEGTMKKILLTKPVEWYELDVAVKLFLFARNISFGEELKMKAVKVLRQHPAPLEQSHTSSEMFRKNQKAAEELFQLAFSSN